jgi:hypothetical protein
LVLAFALWYVVFGLRDVGNFWVKIALAAAALALISLVIMGSDERRQLFSVRRRHIWVGVVTAAILYGVFALGKWVLTALLPFSSAEIAEVYALREELSPWLIASLLLFITGPAEEIYWRGFLQRVLVRKIGPMSGLFLAAALYGLAHIWAVNLSLMLAAFVAGVVWGWIFLIERSLVPVIVSHALWSVTIFVLWPLG